MTLPTYHRPRLAIDTQLSYRAAPLRANEQSTAQAQATMFAATVLALALATTHGLLDEGGRIVQKDASKGLR